MTNEHLIALHIRPPESWAELLEGCELMVVPLTRGETKEVRDAIMTILATVEQMKDLFEPAAAKGELGARLMAEAMRERLEQLNRVRELLGRACFAAAGDVADARKTIQ